MFVIIVLSLCVAAQLVCLLALCRNKIVYEARMKANEVTSQYARKIIDARVEVPWLKAYDVAESYGDYDYMMWRKLNCWRFETLFPNLEDKLNELLKGETVER